MVAFCVIVYAVYGALTNDTPQIYVMLLVTLLAIMFSLADLSKNEILSLFLIVVGSIISSVIAWIVKEGTYDTGDIEVFLNNLTLLGFAIVLASLSIKNLKKTIK